MFVLVYILGKTPNNLLDIGKDMDKLTGRGECSMMIRYTQENPD